MSDTALLSNYWRVILDPDQGCGLMSVECFHQEEWLQVMPDARDPASSLSEASFLLVPYSNRIEDATFSFQGRSFQLNQPARHARHGDVRKRAWKVEKSTSSRLEASFDSRDHQGVNWPWPFCATAVFEVEGPRFTQRLSLENVSHAPMPAGLGWHPYFNRSLTKRGESVKWTFAVKGIYPDDHDNRIPSGPAEEPGADFDFSKGKALRHDKFMDYCACGFDGKARIEWPDSGVTLDFDCSPECGHLVVFNPIAEPFFALEPVTNANNGVNLLARGDETSGIRILEPGEKLEASFKMLLS
jgi:aldose 1-epimerase